MKDLLLAIDQGGSKTDIAVLSSTGEVLFRANDRSIREAEKGPFETCRWNYLRALVQDCISTLGATVMDIRCMMTAMCGADCPDDIVRMRQSISHQTGIPMERVHVVNDCTAALRAGQPILWKPQNSAVIYAGTMFNCSLQAALGATFTYGRLINNDDHGAFSIGNHVWRAILDSYNGFQEQTLMEELFLACHHAGSIPEICQEFACGRRPFVPTEYASILFDAVSRGDKVARDIQKRFAGRWAEYVIKGAPKVGFTHDTEISLYLSGGIFKNCADLWLEEIGNRVKECEYPFRCRLSKMEPVAGAVLLLLEQCNHRPMDIQSMDNLVHSSLFGTMIIQGNPDGTPDML